MHMQSSLGFPWIAAEENKEKILEAANKTPDMAPAGEQQFK